MNSAFLNNLGLGSLDLGLVLTIVIVLLLTVIVLCIINSVNIRKFVKKYSTFMKGRSAKSLEEEIFKMFDENRTMKVDITQTKRDIKSIYKQLSTAYQKLGLVKYDAFDQMGGKLSFVVALLDEDDNGFLINSQHSTDSCYSYVKRIENGKCNLNLSNEEEAALRKAMQTQSNEADEG